jgi:transcriptional regulator with XRE-family HTH domain
MKETIGEYIHKLRIENNLTLTKLAASLDIDQSTLSKIENGKRSVNEELLPKISNIFSIDIKFLEKEYFSERIAELIYKEEDTKDLLILAEEKAKYFRAQKTTQGTIKF